MLNRGNYISKLTRQSYYKLVTECNYKTFLMVVIFSKWNLQLICCLSDSDGTNKIGIELRKYNFFKRDFNKVYSTKQVCINGASVTTLNRFQEILGDLQQPLKLEKLVFDPAVPLKFNFISMRSNLQSNANDKKYQTVLSHMYHFDELFSLISSNVYETLKLNFLFPYIVETQVYIDKYKAKRYQELLTQHPTC